MMSNEQKLRVEQHQRPAAIRTLRKTLLAMDTTSILTASQSHDPGLMVDVTRASLKPIAEEVVLHEQQFHIKLLEENILAQHQRRMKVPAQPAFPDFEPKSEADLRIGLTWLRSKSTCIKCQ